MPRTLMYVQPELLRKVGQTAHHVERWSGRRCKDAGNKDLVGNSDEWRRVEGTSDEGHDTLWVAGPMMMTMMMII